MAKKYVNFRVGGVPETKEDNYTVWTNDLLSKLIASKTVIEPSKSTFGHRLLESEVIFLQSIVLHIVFSLNLGISFTSTPFFCCCIFAEY